MNTPHEQAERLFAQSSSALQASQFHTAEVLLMDALQLEPDLAQAHANLAWLLDRRGSMSEAVRHYQLAVELQPDNARIHLNFGATLAELKLFHAAEAAYQKALQVDPTLPGTWCNLGALQAQNFRDDEAETSLRKALALDPEHQGAHDNLASLLLRKGHYREGWYHLEFRDWYHPAEERLRSGRWRGQSLRDRAVLAMCEGGFADMVQFCRYVTVLREQGAAQVDVLSHPDMKPLLQSLDGVGDVFGFGDDIASSDWDYWVPVLSLPHYVGTHLDNIPAKLPYLQAPADRQTFWRQEINQVAPRPGLRVGLMWRGNPAFENEAQWSLSSLKILAPLWEVPGVKFLSLQKGRGEYEAAHLQASQPMANLAPSLETFSDMAAAIGQLDLVICIDSAVAHLAAALGKPCWLLLPSFSTDWRWLEGRADSPWYPGVMQLWRQPSGNDWSAVVLQVRDALRALGTETPRSTYQK
ncbi:tetratricopeptide repeat protein [Rhodoferax antarcticus]|uniref:tetratricopeptide repeat protein n=1 Tax=Rhodoferax antarcticus TaxID=81479 RepID=UPI002224DE48|nr:tetratricopeptide repeat protein [Rhodoferax antarcticus]MCW2312896.1 Tfp pilus assembly protein PilF [Rhodoferax antarcticus]